MAAPEAPLPSLAGLSLDQLQELDRRVQARLRELRSAARTAKSENFKPGDRVGFLVEGHCIEGEVTEADAAALKVRTSHSHFTIPPGAATRLAVFLLLPALWGAAPAPALAPQDKDMPVVLELFTSQGGSTCPPAERLLSNWGMEVFKQGQALPLAFHVDTYDEFGWKDPFSNADYTKRQHDYDDKLEAPILTPQFIVGGKAAVLLNDRGEAAAQLTRYAGRASAAKLSIGAPAFAKGRLKFKARAQLLAPVKKDAAKYRVLALVFENGLTTQVDAGENKGQTLSNDFVVRAMKDLGGLRKDDAKPWDKDAEFDWDSSWKASQAGAVLLLQDQQTLELRGARLYYPLSAR